MRALTLVLAFCALVAAACGGETAQEASPTTTAPDPSSRPSAPPIEGISLEGERITLAGFRGGPVLVNVWSSW